MFHSFIYSFVDELLGCFHFLATVHSAALNVVVHGSFQIEVFSWCMPRSGISEPYDSSVFSFFKEAVYCFSLNGCVSLHSHQQYRRVPFSSHPLQHLLFVYFFHDDYSDQCEVITSL